MKNFVVKLGNRFIDICAWIFLVMVVIAGINAMTYNFASGVLLLIGGVFSFVFVFYLIYLAISINDSLMNINKLLQENLPAKAENKK